MASAPARSARGDTRQRMIESAATLLREHSAAGVTIDAVLARSGAPRGSIYHHFPGGRDEIVREAVELAGRHVAELIESAQAKAPREVIRALVRFWERVLNQHEFAGCPVVALTVEVGAYDSAESRLVAEVFALWTAQLGSVLRASGVSPARARRLATTVIAAAEGAVLLCRAERSMQPLRDVADELNVLIDAAVG